MRSITVIAGPTASGKSSIALAMAKSTNGVIINADSRQVYKELLIGTARPTVEEMEDIPHYLYGYISVSEPYNVYRYQKDVKALLEKIPKEKQIIMVGGTGLYIDSVVFDYNLQAQDNIPELREELSTQSLEQLQSQILPEVLEQLNESDRNNPRRLVRIIERDGRILERMTQPMYPCKYYVIDLPKEELRTRVEKRTRTMIENGLEQEARNLYQGGYYQYPALRSIGYQEFLPYFADPKQYRLEQVEEAIIKNTMKYIKRQKTWFKRNPNTIWVKDTKSLIS